MYADIPFPIISLRGAEHPEGIEYHGEPKWNVVDEEDFLTVNSPPIGTTGEPGGGEASIVKQFVDAAKGQPGVAFGFQAVQDGRTKTAVVKWEDGKLWAAKIDPDKLDSTEGFAGVNGNDGDADEDDLPLYPSPGVRQESGIDGIVGKLLRESITEDEADSIAKRLLGGSW